MNVENLIERMAKAIHAVRLQKEPGRSLEWQDCFEEAEAAYKAMGSGKRFTYDAKEDFSHIDPI
ncbi:hypothetical protein [Rhizobium leguminosarum]|uniref:hypothetical protein n=1 Tax=Rhizobium leguminosarum TaxID=384 RepID=UPI00103E8415|nr:hypothetical protein [Rhizobium leguminosarum]TBY41581.1 hypothetical protein E0H54_30790 [Rhizobium leguminosarum bv. viciae]